MKEPVHFCQIIIKYTIAISMAWHNLCLSQTFEHTCKYLLVNVLTILYSWNIMYIFLIMGLKGIHTLVELQRLLISTNNAMKQITLC